MTTATKSGLSNETPVCLWVASSKRGRRAGPQDGGRMSDSICIASDSVFRVV